MLDVRLVELNNKSRKGTYLYIKSKKKRGIYLKYYDGEVIDPLVNYYVDRYVKKKPKGSVKKYRDIYSKKLAKIKVPRTPISRQAEQYLRRVKRSLPINKLIKKGINDVIIPDIHQATAQRIHEAKKRLLKDLVLDEGLLNLLVSQENMKKLKSRFEFRVLFKGKDGEVLGQSGKFKDTPDAVLNELKNSFKKGEKVEKMPTPTIARKLEKLRYQKFRMVSEGVVNRIQLQIIFRKAR